MNLQNVQWHLHQKCLKCDELGYSDMHFYSQQGSEARRLPPAPARHGARGGRDAPGQRHAALARRGRCREGRGRRGALARPSVRSVVVCEVHLYLRCNQ